MFSDAQIAMLSAKLDQKHVRERSQSGRALSYIEGWHAIAEANRIFGFGSWGRETVEMRLVSERQRKIGQAQKDGWSVSYVAKARVTVNGVTRDGYGSGHGIDADLGLAHESAVKEAETDAMKRALMTFGNPFGLALYDKEQSNVGNAEAEGIYDTALAAAKMCTTKAELRAWWPSTMPGVQAVMDAADFKRLSAEVKAFAETLPENDQSETEKDAA